jgi:hypothetical protein
MGVRALRPPQQQKAPPSGASLRADDGIRTHDLLHGKRVVGTGPATHETARLSGIRRFSRRSTISESLSFAGDSLGFGHWDRALVPNRALASDVVQPLPAYGKEAAQPADDRVVGDALDRDELAALGELALLRRGPFLGPPWPLQKGLSEQFGRAPTLPFLDVQLTVLFCRSGTVTDDGTVNPPF